MFLNSLLRFFAPLVRSITECTGRFKGAKDPSIADNILLARVLGLQSRDLRRCASCLVFRKGRSCPFAIGTFAAKNGSRVTSAGDAEKLGLAVVEGEESAGAVELRGK